MPLLRLPDVVARAISERGLERGQFMSEVFLAR
jgi:hypothetical protein